MITLSTSPEFISVSGDTYTVRRRIRKAGGLWMAAKDGGKGGYWRVPNNAANLAAMEALAQGKALPEREHFAPQQAAASPPPPPQSAAAQPPGMTPEQARQLIVAAMQPVLMELNAVKAKAAEMDAQRSISLEIKRHDAEAFKIEGASHPMLATLIQGLACGLHVWIAGPSGSGKTHGAEQAAKALGLIFRLQGAMTMAHELTGFVDAGGKYHSTPFVDCFRNGGLCLLDELDAGSNEALLALNAALANAIMCLPSGEIIRAHKDFKCVGSANTFGAGATAEYVGRTRIDAAFLQRFGMRLSWGYDEALEQAISGNVEWAKRVQRARANAARAGLKVLITPRASQAGAKLIASGMTPDQAAELTYLADLSPAQRQQIGG